MEKKGEREKRMARPHRPSHRFPFRIQPTIHLHDLEWDRLRVPGNTDPDEDDAVLLHAVNACLRLHH